MIDKSEASLERLFAAGIFHPGRKRTGRHGSRQHARRDGYAGPGVALDPLSPKKPHHHADGEVGHLPFHGRRPQPCRSVRSQAAADQARRQAHARFDRQALANLARNGEQHPDGLPAQLEAVRAKRHVGVRLVRQHRRARGRYDRHPLLLGGRVESRGIRVPDEHRVDSGRDGRRWARGSPTDWARPTRTCRLSWSCRTVRDPLGGTQQLEFRIPSRALSGHAVPPRGYSDSRSQTARDVSDEQQRNQLGSSAEDEPALGARTSRTIPNSTRASAPTSWPTRCSRRHPTRSIFRRRSEATKKMYGMDEPGHLRFRNQLPDGAATGGAGSALR